MANTNGLSIPIDADPTGLGAGLRQAEREITSFISKVNKIGEIGDQLTSIGKSLTLSLTLPIAGLGTAAIKSFGDIQSLKMGLEAVMGTVEKANAEFERLKEVAKLPGLGMEEAVKGSINLQSIGFSAKKSRNILQQFGNAVATVGKGRAEFERAIYGVQQLANTDFPLGEDLNIIKDALPQVSRLLKEAFGSSRSDEIAKAGHSSQEVLNVILEGLQKLPRVTGGIKGAFENMGDSIKSNLAKIGEVINKNFDISKIVDKLTGYLDKIVSAFENLDPSIQKTIIVIGGVVAAIGPLITVVGVVMSSIPTLTAGIGALSAAFTFLTGPIGLTIAALVGVVTAVVANWGKIEPYIVDLYNGLVKLYNESAIVRNGINAIGLTLETLVNIGKTSLSAIWTQFKTVGKGILELFSGVGKTISSVLLFDWEGVKSGVAQGFNAINNTAIGITKTTTDGIKSLWSDLKTDSKKWMVGFNPKPIAKLSDLFSSKPKDIDDTAEDMADDLIKAADKAKDKVKNKKIEIKALVAVRPVFNNNLFDEIGREFKNLDELTGKKAQESLMINGTMLPTILNNQVKATIEAGIRMQEAIDSFNESAKDILNSAVIDVIGNSMEAFGNALGSGENAISALGNSLLSTLGSVLVQLGKMAISTGVGILGIKTALQSLNPYVAIAAGAALVALGSAVKGSVSNLGNSIGSSGTSTATGSTSTGTTYTTSYNAGGTSGSEVVFRILGSDLVGVLNRQNNSNNRLNAS